MSQAERTVLAKEVNLFLSWTGAEDKRVLCTVLTRVQELLMLRATAVMFTWHMALPVPALRVYHSSSFE